MKIGIVGAGISGLTLALNLHELGFDVEVYESAHQLTPLGLGLNLQPPAVNVLADMGLFDELLVNGVNISVVEFRCEKNKSIFKQKRGLSDGYQFPQIAIHRGKLQEILLKLFLQKVGEDKLYLSHSLTLTEETDNAVKVRLLNRKENVYIDKYVDYLIGADGINSQVRHIIHQDRHNYNFEGIMLWRGVTKSKVFAEGESIYICGNVDVQLVMYPISKPDLNGECYVNWVVEVLDQDANMLPEECWNQQGEAKDFIDYFKDWEFSDPDIVSLFYNAEKIHKFPMVDRDPLKYWGTNRITLIGDAAHPMYPRGANGASQSIIDVNFLCNSMKMHSDISHAFRYYEKERISATSKIVMNNRVTNQVEILSLVKEFCDKSCDEIHSCINLELISNILTQYKNDTNSTDIYSSSLNLGLCRTL